MTGARVGATLVAALAVLVGYVYLSHPDGIAVDRAGQVEGITNVARAGLQGRAFWEQQRRAVEDRLQRQRHWPEVEAKLRAESKQLTRDIAKDFPQVPASGPFAKADALREEADRIEDAAAARMTEQWRLDSIAELEQLLPIVAAKAK